MKKGKTRTLIKVFEERKKSYIPLGNGTINKPEIEYFGLFQKLRERGFSNSDIYENDSYLMDYRSAKLQSIMLDGLQGKPLFRYIPEVEKLRDKFEQKRETFEKQLKSLGLEETNEAIILEYVTRLLYELEDEKNDNLQKQQQYQDLYLESEKLLIKTNPNEYGNSETVFENKILFPTVLDIWQSVKRGFDSRKDLLKGYNITELSLKKDNQLSQKEALLIAIKKHQTNSLMAKYFPLIETNGFENKRIELLFESFKEWLKLQNQLTFQEATEYLNVSDTKLKELISKKEIVFHTPKKKKHYFNKRDIKSWLFKNYKL